MAKNRPPPPISSQHMTKMSSSGTRNMITKGNVNTSCGSASTSGGDNNNMSIINSKNNSNKSVFHKNNTTSMTTKMNVSQGTC